MRQKSPETSRPVAPMASFLIWLKAGHLATRCNEDALWYPQCPHFLARSRASLFRTDAGGGWSSVSCEGCDSLPL